MTEESTQYVYPRFQAAVKCVLLCIFSFRVTVCLNDQNITRTRWIDEEEKERILYTGINVILYILFSCVCSDDTVKKNLKDLPDSYDIRGHYIHSLRAL